MINGCWLHGKDPIISSISDCVNNKGWVVLSGVLSDYERLWTIEIANGSRRKTITINLTLTRRLNKVVCWTDRSGGYFMRTSTASRIRKAWADRFKEKVEELNEYSNISIGSSQAFTGSL